MVTAWKPSDADKRVFVAHVFAMYDRADIDLFIIRLRRIVRDAMEGGHGSQGR